MPLQKANDPTRVRRELPTIAILRFADASDDPDAIATEQVELLLQLAKVYAAG